MFALLKRHIGALREALRRSAGFVAIKARSWSEINLGKFLLAGPTHILAPVLIALLAKSGLAHAAFVMAFAHREEAGPIYLIGAVGVAAQRGQRAAAGALAAVAFADRQRVTIVRAKPPVPVRGRGQDRGQPDRLILVDLEMTTA
jgi:hypothetical protein